MSDDEVRYEHYSVGQLVELAERTAANKDAVVNVPISLERARSHAANPAAKPNDPALVTAWMGERCVGFFGLMPTVYWRDGKMHSVSIGTTMLVDPISRGKGIAKTLVRLMHEKEPDFIITGATPPAESLYSKVPYFEKTEGVRYSRVFLYPPALGIFALEARWVEDQGKRELVAHARKVERGLAKSGLRALVHRALWPKPGRGFEHLEARPVKRIEVFGADEPTPAEGDSPHFVRTERFVNWVLEYPWIVEAPGKKSDFYFSTYRDLFRYLPYEFVNKTTGEVVGYAVYTVTSRRDVNFLKFTFYRLKDKAEEGIVFETAGNIAQEYGIDVMVGPDELGTWAARRKRIKPLVQRLWRCYFVHRKSDDSALHGPADQLGWDFMDGDLPFN